MSSNGLGFGLLAAAGAFAFSAAYTSLEERGELNRVFANPFQAAFSDSTNQRVRVRYINYGNSDNNNNNDHPSEGAMYGFSDGPNTEGF